MKRREFVELSAVGVFSSLIPSFLFAKGKQNYKGKHGSISILPSETPNEFQLEINGIAYNGTITRGGERGLKLGLQDGEHKITIENIAKKYAITRGNVEFDLDGVPAPIEPIPNHLGPAGGVILIILIIYGKWPPKPGKKKVRISVDNAEIQLSRI